MGLVLDATASIQNSYPNGDAMMIWHQHRYKSIAAKAYQYRHGWETTLLRRCDCGCVTTQRIDGAWTLDELVLGYNLSTRPESPMPRTSSP